MHRTANARYCYSVWLRHLSLLDEYGLNTNPSTIAELGPGDSIGVGLMALLTGSQEYYALDTVKHTSLEHNILLIDEIADNLLKRVDIPSEEEFPKVHPILKSYDFPSKIITEERMADNLDEKRIRHLKNILAHYEADNDSSSPRIQYFCPWHESTVLNKESVDMIYSQAVLEHVDDLGNAYEAMHLWLKPGGVMSHQIDFKSHGSSESWNGHWAYSDYEWKLVRGNRAYLINREPLSTHIDFLDKTGFEILCIIPVKTYPSEKYTESIHRNQLAKRFQKLPEADFTTCNAHILSVKI
jgi:SAM-dependent methyltransferase